MVTERTTDPGVLVADDDDLVRLVIRRVLERAGHRVTEVGTVDAAIEACTASPFSLAILDAHMPGGDLTTSIAGIRNALPDIPILIISGDNATPAEADLPRTAFLSKPLEIASLTTVVGLLLGALP